MNRTVVKHVIVALVLVLFQTLVLQYAGFLSFVPLVYLYAVLIWPVDMPVWRALLLGFLIGLAVDVLLDCPGMHAAATTFAVYLRRPLLRTFLSKEETEGMEPGERSMGFLGFWKYALVMILCHHFVLYLVESFSWADPWMMLLRTLVSSLLTGLLVFLFERFRR